jgi:hypothetical protein
MCACVAALPVCAQAWDNFKQEWMQLRRSFRFNEYGKISAVNPPQGPIGKVSNQQRWCMARTHTAIQQQWRRCVGRREFSVRGRRAVQPSRALGAAATMQLPC